MPGETAVTGGIEGEEKIGDGLALRASPTGFEQSKCDANRRRAGQSVDIDDARLHHIRARPVGSKLPGPRASTAAARGPNRPSDRARLGSGKHDGAP